MSAASEAFALLATAMLTADPGCNGDTRFTQESYSTGEALRLAEICATCPVYDLCKTWSELERPKVGLYAGGRTYRTNRPRTTTPKDN